MSNVGPFRSSWRLSVALLLAVALLVVAVPGTLLAAPTARPAASWNYVYYTVQPGDSLIKIALRYGVSQSTLMEINGISNANHIYVGQVLKIPAAASGCGSYHTVQYGQTLSGIAVYYGVSQSALAQANNISHWSYVYAGQKLCIPGTGGPVYQPGPGFYYVVRPGDTLSAIAWRQGTTVYAIMAANGLASANKIYAGQKLLIPGTGYVPPAPPPYQPPPYQPPPPKPQPTPVPSQMVWTGLYYNNTGFGGTPVLVRQDAAIQFDWGAGSPAPSINSNSFSALWTTSAYFGGGSYRFYATADDGVRIYVDDKLVVDGWGVHPAQGYFGDVALGAGYHTVRVEYFEAEGMASIKVNWAKL